jgi:hypothetical protein
MIQDNRKVISMKKFVYSAAAVLMALCAATGGSVSAAPEKTEMPAVASVQAKKGLSKAFRNKYKKILDSYEEFSGVYIGDLMGDEREELVVAVNPLGITDIYVPEGNVIKKYHFDVMSVWGFTKYDKYERTIVNLEYYGHTEGAPFELYMQSVAFEDGNFSPLSVRRTMDSERSVHDDEAWTDVVLNYEVNGRPADSAEFTIIHSLLVAETADTEYIPYVEHHKGDLVSEPAMYRGSINETDYETYIQEKLG